MMDADELYRFILANVEEIDGQLICRASLIAELRRRGVETPGRVRKELVGELSARGLVVRPHPRSRWLIVIDSDAAPAPSAHERFMDRMGFGDEPGAIDIDSSTYEHDQRATNRRIKNLATYMATNVLSGKRFVCSSWRDCERSIGSECTFKEGQMSHVGRHFDLSHNGRALRIVVVGQEVAAKGKARTTMDERYARVHNRSGLDLRFDGDKDHERRNPHMRGTTLALGTIFGLSGSGHASEFLDVGGERVHMFDCFALVNRLLCAAHLRGTSTGKSTKTMLSNCERHFAASLEILEPTIVIIQGIKVWKWSQSVLVPTRGRGQTLYECDLASRRVLVCVFTHPSAWGVDRWDSPHSPYFRQVVRPTIRRALQSSMAT